jgi:hypothetical protein
MLQTGEKPALLGLMVHNLRDEIRDIRGVIFHIWHILAFIPFFHVIKTGDMTITGVHSRLNRTTLVWRLGVMLSGRTVPLIFWSGAGGENHATMTGKIEVQNPDQSGILTLQLKKL